MTTTPDRESRPIWDGVLHGTLGVLASDGDRVQCHGCGKFFKAAGTHLVRRHGITADEYRRLFGLRSTTGFAGPPVKARLRQTAVERFSQYWRPGPRPAGFQERGEHHGPSPEARLDPAVRARWEAHGRRLVAWNAQARADGREVSVRRGRDATAQAVARWKELLADPKYKAAHVEKIRKTRQRRVFTCKECGSSFVRSANWKGWRVCSPACHKAWKSRRAGATRPSSRPEVRARVMAERRQRAAREDDYDALVLGLRALAVEHFAALSPRARDVVRRYYGLDGPPESQQAIADSLGIVRESVRDMLRSRAVRGLLPEARGACGGNIGEVGRCLLSMRSVGGIACRTSSGLTSSGTTGLFTPPDLENRHNWGDRPNSKR